MPNGMGDLLRRIFYPLVLPAVVVSVWAHAWMMKADDPRPRQLAPAIPSPLASTPSASPRAQHHAGYGFAADDDEPYASADAGADRP